MFRKVGDIKTQLDAGGSILYQTVEYLYFASHIFSPYSCLAITRYANGKISLILEASSDEQYNALKQAYRSGGFPKPDYLDDRLKCITLSNDNKDIIAHFLKVLNKLEPSFSSVENEIYEFVGIDPLYEHEMPVWIKDNFNKNTVIYRSAEKTELDISQFEIIAHRHNMVSFSVTAANQASYEDLEYLFTELGFPFPLDSEKNALKLFFNLDSDTYYQIDLLLNALRPFCSYKLILEDIRQCIVGILSPINPSHHHRLKEITLTSEQCESALKNLSIFRCQAASTESVSVERVPTNLSLQ